MHAYVRVSACVCAMWMHVKLMWAIIPMRACLGSRGETLDCCVACNVKLHVSNGCGEMLALRAIKFTLREREKEEIRKS